jgi:hypothetical protein
MNSPSHFVDIKMLGGTRPVGRKERTVQTRNTSVHLAAAGSITSKAILSGTRWPTSPTKSGFVQIYCALLDRAPKPHFFAKTYFGGI